MDELKAAQEAYDKAQQELMAAASRLEEAKRQATEQSPPEGYEVDY